MATLYVNTSTSGFSPTQVAPNMLNWKTGKQVIDLNAGSGTNGYFKWLTISLAGTTYTNTPLTFVFHGRGYIVPSIVTIQFASANSADPALSYFLVEGHFRNFYAKKTATSTWDFFVQKAEAYDNCSIVDFNKNISYDSKKLTFKNEIVTALPSGYVTAANNNPIVVSSAQPTGPNAMIWIKG